MVVTSAEERMCFYLCMFVCFICFMKFLDPEGGSQKATLLFLVVICSPGSKNPQGFLDMQQSATKLCVHIHADIAHRSAVSDFLLVF